MLPIFVALALSTPSEAPLELRPSLPEPDPLAAVPSGALVPASASPVLADDDFSFSYTFVEVGSIFYDPDFDAGIDNDVDTYYGRASLNLFKLFYIFAGYENQNFEFEDTDADLIRLGVGAHVSVAPKLDLQADIAWLYADLASDLDALTDDTSGYEARGGVRWMPWEWGGGGLEVAGGITYQGIEYEVTDDDGLFGWDLGLRLHFLKLLSVGASFVTLEDNDAFLVNGRVSF